MAESRNRPPWATYLLGLMLPAIWWLDLTWWHLSPDVVIIVALIPLAWHLARQSMRSAQITPVRMPWVYASVVSLVCGVLLNQMFLMASGWAGLAVLFCFPSSLIPKVRLWIMCVGAFPWVLLDLTPLSWWFRLSGAALTGQLFHALGKDVVVHGTLLEIDGLPISIEAACGGMQLLQVLMSGGVALTLMRYPQRTLFWGMLALLPLLAWTANTARIILISAWGLAFGAERAAGAFHTWGALLVLGILLTLYHALSLALEASFKVEGEIHDR
ncbi:archaeosortase/exosortase family protein [Coraliomargarita sp. SDUM461003]|uniref:Archaeosortase/exosortase family protein n=1 Tax=Thalassobacterium maritimum TaxID=3041265 RepID=A0ABU1AS04_9BACT|nr:archaeosortase/exosortase family protein [Coraliomargarita sp. SDUM461003]MDQ8206933.1 archaeosortase/exosortase family protein [Coraliomargarita sp. SDUM461003]